MLTFLWGGCHALLVRMGLQQLFTSRAKNWFGRFDPDFIECRRFWLDEYMGALVRNAELASSNILNHFLSAAVVQPSSASQPVALPPAQPSLNESPITSGGAHASAHLDMNGVSALRERKGGKSGTQV